MALQSLQIFSLCYVQKLLPFLRPKVVAISTRNTIMRKFANFVRLYFRILQHFSTKFWDFITVKSSFQEFGVFLSGFV